MHVLWTPSWYPTPDDPFNGSFFKEQVEILRNAGNEVGVCYLAPKSFWQWRPAKPVIDQDNQVVMSTFPTVPKGVVGGDKAIIEEFAKRLGREYALKWGAPDIIHAHSVFPGVLVAQTLADFWDIPYGLTEHRPSSLQSRESSPRTKAIKKAVQSADFRLAVSEKFAQELNDKYDEDFGVVDLPVPDEYFETERSERLDQVFRFVHVSHLAPNKRVEETIQAFAKVHKKFPKTELHVIGGNLERTAELEKAASESGIANSVKFLGKVPREDLPATLVRYDVLVLISQKESGGAVFAEAHSLGIPTIATATFGGLHMVTPGTGVVVPIDHSESLVEAMENFASGQTDFDSNDIRKIASERFSSKIFADKHFQIYDQALSAFSNGRGDNK